MTPTQAAASLITVEVDWWSEDALWHHSQEQADSGFPATPGAAAQVEAAAAEAESQGADLAEVTPAPPAEPPPEGVEPVMGKDEPSAADLQKARPTSQAASGCFWVCA